MTVGHEYTSRDCPEKVLPDFSSTKRKSERETSPENCVQVATMTVTIEMIPVEPGGRDGGEATVTSILDTTEQRQLVVVDDRNDKGTTTYCRGGANNNYRRRPHRKRNRVCLLVMKLVVGWSLTATAMYWLTILVPFPFQDNDSPFLTLFDEDQKPILRFHPDDHVFRIMQITDIHLGEAEDTDWGPEQDAKTWKMLEKILTLYEQPDLIVLGGDQLTANDCIDNCTTYYRRLGDFLSVFGIPWATILGNHDDLEYQKSDPPQAHNYTRRELLAVDQAYPLSLTETGPASVTGASNYVLNVWDYDDDGLLELNQKRPALQIFFLDSGGGTLPEAITDSQVQWFRHQQHKQLSQQQDLIHGQHDVLPPAVAFQHIPTHQHQPHVGCMGFHDDGVEEIHSDAGIVDALVESNRFAFLGVGHNHGNDYCCPYQANVTATANINNANNVTHSDLYFCYGRHSGYGGYGTWTRGVRMYEMKLTGREKDSNDNGLTQKNFHWRSWVRLESGAYVDHFDWRPSS